MKLMHSSSGVLDVDVQIALSDDEEPPSSHELSLWAQTAYQASSDSLIDTEVTIRLVSEQEIQLLNRDYRQKDKVTNVLAFAFDMPAEFGGDALDEAADPIALLGDIVICHAVVVTEAEQQNKTVTDHYAHMVTHGVLHLCGYDHIDEQDALTMEALETTILATHGIANPYS